MGKNHVAELKLSSPPLLVIELRKVRFHSLFRKVTADLEVVSSTPAGLTLRV